MVVAFGFWKCDWGFCSVILNSNILFPPNMLWMLSQRLCFSQKHYKFHSHFIFFSASLIWKAKLENASQYFWSVVLIFLFIWNSLIFTKVIIFWLICFVFYPSKLFKTIFSVQNLPWQSANAEGFAEACLCFSVSALAKKMLRQLNS